MPESESGDSDVPDLRESSDDVGDWPHGRRNARDLEEVFRELDSVSALRREAMDQQSAASVRCREIVIALMRRGVKPKELVGRPFSMATITEIRMEIGLSKSYPKRRKTRKHS